MNIKTPREYFLDEATKRHWNVLYGSKIGLDFCKEYAEYYHQAKLKLLGIGDVVEQKEFREAHPETVGETDKTFDLQNYAEWLESKLSEAEKQRDELLEGIHKVYNAGYSGITQVGMANYTSRELDAKSRLRKVFEQAIKNAKP